MRTLYVYYRDILVGLLHENEDLIYSFQYDKSWLNHPEKFALSGNLILQEETFGNKATLAFFENLLPEGDVRDGLKRAGKTHSHFDFLEQYGKDCAGAIVISNQPDYISHINDQAHSVLRRDNINKALREKRSIAEMIAGENPGYLSTAGAQDKFPAVFQNGEFKIPTQGGATTHIIKVPIWRGGVKESVFNELFCMSLAQKIGFQVPHHFVLDGEYPLFIIERYDRIFNTSPISRLHQQDLCQMLGIESNRKYESKGGPNIQVCYSALKKNLSPKFRIKGLQDFLDWICFNLVIGNHDSHAKNFSLLAKNKSWQTAPLYDLLCTTIYKGMSSDFCFSIGERYEFPKIGKNQIMLLETELKLKPQTLLKRLSKIKELVLENKEPLLMEMKEQFPNVKVFQHISDEIEKRIRSLKRQHAVE